MMKYIISLGNIKFVHVVGNIKITKNMNSISFTCLIWVKLTHVIIAPLENVSESKKKKIDISKLRPCSFEAVHRPGFCFPF